MSRSGPPPIATTEVLGVVRIDGVTTLINGHGILTSIPSSVTDSEDDSMKLVTSQTAANNTSINLVNALTDTYNNYELHLNVALSGSGNIYIRFSSDGGNTYDSSSSYSYGVRTFYAIGGGVSTDSNDGAESTTAITVALVAPGSFPLNSELRFYNLRSGSLLRQMIGETVWAQAYGGSTINLNVQNVGSYLPGTPVDSIQIYTDSGMTLTGTVTLFGLP